MEKESKGCLGLLFCCPHFGYLQSSVFPTDRLAVTQILLDFTSFPWSRGLATAFYPTPDGPTAEQRKGWGRTSRTALSRALRSSIVLHIYIQKEQWVPTKTYFSHLHLRPLNFRAEISSQYTQKHFCSPGQTREEDMTTFMCFYTDLRDEVGLWRFKTLWPGMNFTLKD